VEYLHSHLQIANAIYKATNKILDKAQKEKRKRGHMILNPSREQEKSIQQVTKM